MEARKDLSPNTDPQADDASGESPAAGYSIEALRALGADPAVGVALVADTGDVLFANRRITELLTGNTPEEAIGRNLAEMYPPESARERLEILKRVSSSGRPAILRHIRFGRQVQSTMYAVETPEGHPGRILVVTVAGESKAEDENQQFDVFESKVADLGPLDVLTRRELEVLSLIGQGLSTIEIGELLFRSHRTVEKHRESIARKLGEASRVKLAEIARSAGLELRDASLPRVSSDGPRKAED